MSEFIKFYFTSSMLNMFRTLIHPSSRACNYSIVSPHWLCVLVSMCFEVSVWLGWGGIRVAGCCASMPLHVSSSMCSSSGGQNCIIHHLVSLHCVGGRHVHRLHRTATYRV